jgi:hypothetical protein
MHRHLRFPTLPLALACSGPDLGPGDFALQPGAPPPVVTDREVYPLARVDGGYAAEALATYTNTTGRTVYFQRCMPDDHGPMYDLRRTGADSTAESFVGDVWACIGGVPTGHLRPRESISVRVSLGSTDSPQAQPPIAAADRVGRFRIEFALCVAHVDDSDDCEPLPQAARESNAFEIRF